MDTVSFVAGFACVVGIAAGYYLVRAIQSRLTARNERPEISHGEKVEILLGVRRDVWRVLDDLNRRDLPVLANYVGLVIPKIEDAIYALRGKE